MTSTTARLYTIARRLDAGSDATACTFIGVLPDRQVIVRHWDADHRPASPRLDTTRRAAAIILRHARQVARADAAVTLTRDTFADPATAV